MLVPSYTCKHLSVFSSIWGKCETCIWPQSFIWILLRVYEVKAQWRTQRTDFKLPGQETIGAPPCQVSNVAPPCTSPWNSWLANPVWRFPTQRHHAWWGGLRHQSSVAQLDGPVILFMKADTPKGFGWWIMVTSFAFIKLTLLISDVWQDSINCCCANAWFCRC